MPKREVGVSPTRSRHCKVKRPSNATGKLGRRGER
nr:MAG TPA: hypothetical protein [Caudoviricetes sp.]